MHKIIPPNVKEVNLEQPVRIQRKRTRGWRMPPNTIYVGRPTMWSNPFDWRALPGVTDNEAKRYIAQHFDVWLKTGQWWKSLELVQAMDISLVKLEKRRQWMLDNIRKLSDHNLACFCPLDQPCHADVLLELANRATTSKGERCQ